MRILIDEFKLGLHLGPIGRVYKFVFIFDCRKNYMGRPRQGVARSISILFRSQYRNNTSTLEFAVH